MGRSRSCTCQERHAKRHAEGPNMAKQFRESLQADLLHTVFICFLCDAGTKKLPRSRYQEVSFNYHVLIGKYCK